MRKRLASPRGRSLFAAVAGDPRGPSLLGAFGATEVAQRRPPLLRPDGRRASSRRRGGSSTRASSSCAAASSRRSGPPGTRRDPGRCADLRRQGQGPPRGVHRSVRSGGSARGQDAAAALRTTKTRRRTGPAPARPPAAGPGERTRSRPSASEDRVIDTLAVSRTASPTTYRRLGFAVVAAVPQAGILRGRGAVVSLADGPMSRRGSSKPTAARYVSLEPGALRLRQLRTRGIPGLEDGRGRDGAPGLPRRALVARRGGGLRAASGGAGAAAPSTAADAALVAGGARARRPWSSRRRTCSRSCCARGRSRAEMKLKARYVGAGDEYRLRDQVAATHPDLVLTRGLSPAVPDWTTTRSGWTCRWSGCARDRPRAVEPEVAAGRRPRRSRSRRRGSTTPRTFRRRVREAIARGLSPDGRARGGDDGAGAAARARGPAGRRSRPGKIANLVVETGEPFAAGSRVTEIWIDGRRLRVPGHEDGDAGDGGHRSVREAGRPPPDVRPSAGAGGDGPVAAPKAVVVRGATVWTQGPAGDPRERGPRRRRTARSSRSGRASPRRPARSRSTAAASTSRPASSTATRTPRSTATSTRGRTPSRPRCGSATSSTRTTSPIYRELAGGTTAANVLHGSANAIGGQNAMVKLRWGGAPDDLLIAGAPAGIKFALGENPKQSNFQQPAAALSRRRAWASRTLIRERFLAARDYRQPPGGVPEGRRGRRARSTPIPPRRTCSSRRSPRSSTASALIHCHSYRKDEILELIRVGRGVRRSRSRRSSTSLEGYKVADEIAQHGAGGLDLLRLVGLQVRGLRRDPVQRRAACASAASSSPSTPTPTSSPAG